MTKMLPRALLAGFLAAGAAVACGGSQTAPRDVRAEAAATAVQRLQGRWLLQSFQPDAPLEFALQQLLNAQIGQLVVEVNGTNATIRGLGVSVPRTLRIDEAYENHFQAMIIDSYGVGSRASGDFNGNLLLINAMEAPWRGRGTLARLP